MKKTRLVQKRIGRVIPEDEKEERAEAIARKLSKLSSFEKIQIKLSRKGICGEGFDQLFPEDLA